MPFKKNNPGCNCCDPHINEFHLFAAEYCEELAAPVHNTSCTGAPTDGHTYESGTAKTYLKSVTVTNDANPNGLVLYTMPATGGGTNRYDSTNPPLGRYSVVVTGGSADFTYVPSGSETAVTVPQVQFGPDRTFEFTVGGPGYKPSYVAPGGGGRVCDVWVVPGPHVETAYASVYADYNFGFDGAGGTTGWKEVGNSLAVGTIPAAANPYGSIFQGQTDAIQIPSPASSRHKGTIVWLDRRRSTDPRGYFVYTDFYCSVNYEASTCGIYVDGTRSAGGFVRFNRGHCVQGGGYGGTTPTDPNMPVMARHFSASVHEPKQATINVNTGKVKVGLLMPCLNMGGGESWTYELLKSTSSVLDWQGVVCVDPVAKTNDYMRSQISAYCPISYGLDAIAPLASKCDVIVSWIVEDHQKWMGPSATKLVWVDHFPHDTTYDSVTQFCLRTADSIVGVSEVCTPGVPAAWTNKYKVIYNAADLDKLVVKRDRSTMRGLWGVPSSAPVAGFYARMALEKRPDAMIRLIQSLPPNWHVVMIGDSKPYPDEAAYLQGLIAKLPTSVQSRLHVQPADPATGDVMNAFDVLVNPPQVESFGLSMVEAMAVGLPVVSTPFGIAKLRSQYVYPVALDDTGANLAAAVFAAKLGGAKLGAKSFATVGCSPSIFSAAWTTLIQTVAGRPIVLPNLLTQAKSFTSAMVNHAASGFAMADDETVKQRENICATCPYLVGENTCGHCGCGLKAKRALTSSQCPIGKW